MKSRRDLVREYHETKPAMGVLRIRHRNSGRALYVGGVNLPALENRLRFQLDLGTHGNARLQADWKTEGEAAFVFEVVSLLARREGVDDYRDEIEALESLCLEQDEPWEPRGYHPSNR